MISISAFCMACRGHWGLEEVSKDSPGTTVTEYLPRPCLEGLPQLPRFLHSSRVFETRADVPRTELSCGGRSR